MILTAGVAAMAAWTGRTTHAGRRARVRRAADRVDRRHADHRPRRRGAQRLTFLALPLPAACSPGSRSPGSPRRPDPPVGDVNATLPSPCGRPALDPRGAVRQRGVGRDARVQRRASHRAVRHVDTATGVAPASGRVPPREPVGGPRRGARAPGCSCLSLAAAVAVALTWTVTPMVAVALVLLRPAALSSRRTVAGTVYGFSVAGELGREVGTVRGVTTQLGYLIGALVGGAAIAISGFALLGVAMGGLFVASDASLRFRVLQPCEEPRGRAAFVPARCTRGRSASGTGRFCCQAAAERRRGSRARGIRPAGEQSRRTRFQRLATALACRARVPRRRRATRHALVVPRGRRPPRRDRAPRPRWRRPPRSRSRSPTSTTGSGSARRSPQELLADARAAGITEVTSLVSSDNPAAVSSWPGRPAVGSPTRARAVDPGAALT